MKRDGKDLGARITRRKSGDSMSQDQTGAMRATCVFTCEWRAVLRLMPRRWQSRHPDFNNLICESVSAEKDGPIAVITAEYVGGVDSSGTAGSDSNSDSAPVVSVSSTVSQEPIQTHPDFTSTLAGTPEAPLNGAVFDEDGAFIKFGKLENGNNSPHAGVTDYLAPRIVVRKTTLSKAEPSNVLVGFKEASPYGQGDFLKTAHNFTRQGSIYVVEEEWLGPARGAVWNSDIYDS